jgi:RNA polymerase sigma-70 factor (ECF subfamily)
MEATLASVRESDHGQAITAALPSLLPRLYNFARYQLGPDDARDAVGAALEHLWRNRSKAPDADAASVERWAMRVAVNKMLDEVRRHRRRPSQISLSDLDISVSDPNDRLPQLLQLRAALETLARRDADLVALRFGADLSNLEIAELWNMTPGAVAVAVHRALGRLRTEIGLKGDSDART